MDNIEIDGKTLPIPKGIPIVLHNPADHSLADCLRALKAERPANSPGGPPDSDLLDKWIKEVEG